MGRIAQQFISLVNQYAKDEWGKVRMGKNVPKEHREPYKAVRDMLSMGCFSRDMLTPNLVPDSGSFLTITYVPDHQDPDALAILFRLRDRFTFSLRFDELQKLCFADELQLEAFLLRMYYGLQLTAEDHNLLTTTGVLISTEKARKEVERLDEKLDKWGVHFGREDVRDQHIFTISEEEQEAQRKAHAEKDKKQDAKQKKKAKK